MDEFRGRRDIDITGDEGIGRESPRLIFLDGGVNSVFLKKTPIQGDIDQR